MNYENIRRMVDKAIEAVDERIRVEQTGIDTGDGFCEIDSITFDSSLSEPGEDRDDVMVTIRFRWDDCMVHKKTHGAGETGEIIVEEEDFFSAMFVAGLIYAYILMAEGQFPLGEEQ